MRLYIALLISLTLHASLVVAPNWLTAWQRATQAPPIDVRLLPKADPNAQAESVSTETSERAVPPRAAEAPRPLRGRSLRQARSALSEHLFYPPQAVAQGLEGDVILLLTLSENGQLISASIARSSGHALLDQAALDAARHIGALPGNPRQTLFPVNFRLQ